MEINNNNKLFDLYSPTSNEFIGIVSIPHSGEYIPEIFEPYLTKNLRHRIEDVDTKVNELVDIKELQKNGIAVLVSHIQRICVDLNRSEELCVLNWKKNSQGETLVTKEPTKEEVEDFIATYHRPYFDVLRSILDRLSRLYKRPSFIDLHSMPSKATAYHLSITPNQPIHRPDFCVSDVMGKSCEKPFIDFVTNELGKHYTKVNQNDPYFGGHITRHIDELYPHANNIQIEINRANYMDETSKELTPRKVEFMKPILTETLIKTMKNFLVKNNI